MSQYTQHIYDVPVQHTQAGRIQEGSKHQGPQTNTTTRKIVECCHESPILPVALSRLGRSRSTPLPTTAEPAAGDSPKASELLLSSRGQRKDPPQR
jgi:hypothetical protein